jgi:hypothetical protein
MNGKEKDFVREFASIKDDLPKILYMSTVNVFGWNKHVHWPQ